MTSQTQGLHNLIKRPFKPPIRQSHGQTLWKYVFKKGRYASDMHRGNGCETGV